MSFIECPECGEEYSEHAPECPNCGGEGRRSNSEAEREGESEVDIRGTAARRASESSERPDEVVVADIRMGFGSMVVFMVKWVLASIPALLILALLGAFASAFLAGFASGL